jgi:preprotein translocase subunit YajC
MNSIDTLLMMGEGGKPNPMMNLVFMVGMIGVMYFFMIRPQMKRAKEQKEFSNQNNVGDTIKLKIWHKGQTNDVEVKLQESNKQ